MKKWLIGIGILLAIAAMYYYSKKEKSAVAESDADAEDWEPKVRGEANSIDDLPLECQSKYVGWARWMESVKTTNAWPKSLIARAAEKGTTFEEELERTFVIKYNENAATGQCDE